jgi:hypothetical protein
MADAQGEEEGGRGTLSLALFRGSRSDRHVPRRPQSQVEPRLLGGVRATHHFSERAHMQDVKILTASNSVFASTVSRRASGAAIGTGEADTKHMITVSDWRQREGLAYDNLPEAVKAAMT